MPEVDGTKRRLTWTVGRAASGGALSKKIGLNLPLKKKRDCREKQVETP